MRPFFLGTTAAMVLLGAGVAVRAQAWRSFDPDLAQKGTPQKLCDEELPPSDGSEIDAKSWQMGCVDLDKRLENSEFVALRGAADKGSKAERDAYSALLNAFQSYKKLHLEIDTKGCGPGNDCPAMMDQEEAQINYDFLFMAEGFRGTGFPSFSGSEAAAADAALNAAYKADLLGYPLQCPNTGNEMDFFCVSRSEFREMERAWMHYRDAWAAYGAIKWPNVSAYTWCAYLTLQHNGPHGGL